MQQIYQDCRNQKPHTAQVSFTKLMSTGADHCRCTEITPPSCSSTNYCLAKYKFYMGTAVCWIQVKLEDCARLKLLQTFTHSNHRKISLPTSSAKNFVETHWPRLMLFQAFHTTSIRQKLMDFHNLRYFL